MNQLEKIYRPERIHKILDVLPRPLVMTNGVFDILHRGHVTYLQEAATLGETLVVAINSDSSVKSLGKGDERPLNTEEDRAWMLANLESVGIVTYFEEKTPLEILKMVRPDIYVKGADYNMNDLEEKHLVESWGGRAITIPFLTGYSTSKLIEKIRSTMKQ